MRVPKSLLTAALTTAVLTLGLPATATAAVDHHNSGHVDVLFIGAHPDDEAGDLATFGQWKENQHVTSGVVTITRGEGGGNAAGPEEGPALGLIREAEERRAVGMAGVTDVHNLDKVDFYYTVSAPLTASVWDEQQTLEKIVRLVREIQPKVIVTMNPSPFPGQHGNHQEAAHLAIDAFYAAADPAVFPAQRLATWRTARLFTTGATGSGPKGPDCASAFVATDPTAQTFGVWTGTPSQAHGTSWAQVERDASRQYLTQGYGSRPPTVPTDPTQLGCEMFTQLDSRVPYEPHSTATTAMLQGAAVPAPGGLPLGTEFYLTTSTFQVIPGKAFTVTAHTSPLPHAKVALALPAGWTASGNGAVSGGRATFVVTPPANAAVSTRATIGGTLTSGRTNGSTERAVAVTANVTGSQQLLPQVADFQSWASKAGLPQLLGFVKPVLTLASGGSRTVAVSVTNNSSSPQSGSVTLKLPAGFAADTATKPYANLAPSASASVNFAVRNTNASLPNGIQGGDYDYTITTSSSGASDTANAALELVPTTTIPKATSTPAVDGVNAPGEYPGSALDLSRRWEGDDCTSAADCSGTAQVSWSDDALYFLVHVTDDTLGKQVDPSDCKRHWRTDSVEITLDPRGSSENTSTTFKTGIFPITNGGPACWERDADNHQGPGADTAPGMQVVAKVSAPYNGYTLEAKIPLADLPAAVDPARLGLNILVYDSDTQDLTGQTRLAWSPFGGVQGDPYRWGLATVDGYTAPPGRPTTPSAPVIPATAASSMDSPQSILQSASIGVPLAGGPAASRADAVRLAFLRGGQVTALVQSSEPAKAHVFVYDPVNGTLASTVVPVSGVQTIRLPVSAGKVTRQTKVLVAFEASYGTTSSAVSIII
jgi:LmbE family N-acetylglucosaminyl deacetylase